MLLFARRIPTCLCLCLTLATLPAMARAECESLTSFTRETAADLMAAMISPEVSALDQLFAFEDLMCASQPGLRELALRTASLAENPVVRGQVLMRSIFEKEILSIHLDTPEDPTEAETRRLASEPVVALAVRYRDPAQGCMSFVARGTCDASSLASVFGTTMDITITYDKLNLTGSFTYDHGDRLTGQVSIQDESFPAWIALY